LNPKTNTLTSELRARLPEDLPPRLGVAVSGGGDSVALMHLLHEIAVREDVTLFAATVDHGLRPDSRSEADAVAAQATRLGLTHEILNWRGWDGSGNLQDQARQARYMLLGEWAQRNQIHSIALGHTADDQAETVLMRLGRAAGVTGLSAMPAVRHQNGVDLLRPMLSITRQSLRDYLAEIDVNWAEDPSNRDMRFDRIKAREALAGLFPLGITARTLSRVAENMSSADEALSRFAQESARKITSVEAGDILLDRIGFAALPSEMQRRLLVGAVSWLTGPGYPPRQSAVEQAIGAVQSGKSGAIGGCLLVPQCEKMWICREFQAVTDSSVPAGEIWDRRWKLTGPQMDGVETRPLGETGVRLLTDWRAVGRPRLALQSSPAAWRGENLLAAPLAGFANGWVAEPAPDHPEFHASFLSH